MKNAAWILLVVMGLSFAGQTRAAADAVTDEKLDKILAELKDVKKELEIIKVRVST